MNNFWKQLEKPFFILAPMYDVTDIAFRQMFVRYGKPDAFVTEFVSAEGITHHIGSKKLEHLLRYEKNERPIVAQIFSADADAMERAAAYVAALGFDGVDINMGCPEKNIQKQGAGAALIKSPDQARAIIDATKQGAGDMPVSVKTRIGYNVEEIDTWIVALLKSAPDALTVHLRTKKEMSTAPAHWEYMKHIIELRNKISPETVIIGNGDINNMSEARDIARTTGCDGVMIGRGAFGNPWFFADKKAQSSDKEQLEALKEHINLYHNYFNDIKNFAVMKKHFKSYTIGIEGIATLREELMNADKAYLAIKQINTFIRRIK